MATPDQVAAQIRFQLDQLSAKNGHHEFEHLCRHLARATICEHILPATGPVSAGGDQGRDFETFQTFLASAGRTTGFVGFIAADRIAFVCTLEKGVPPKVRSDLKKIHESGFPGKHVYCFTPNDVPVAKRNKLKTFALDTYGIALEIFDGQAISEILAGQKTFWIAVRFLSIASEITLDPGPDAPKWYEATRTKYAKEEPARVTHADFLEFKQGIRFATFNESHRSDVLVWRKRLERFLIGDHPPELRRRAKYEIAVAAIRGLGTANDCRTMIGEHMSEALTEGTHSALEDAEVLLSYCSGGVLAGAIEIPEATLSGWEDELRVTLDERLKVALTENDRCLLLQARGALCLRVSKGVDFGIRMKEALGWWLRMITHLHAAPLFPLDRFSELLAFLAEWVEDYDSYSRLTQAVDAALSKRKGKAAAAERCHERAIAFAKAGRLRFALRELHRAKVDWFAAETLDASVRAMIFISQCYYDLRLPVAAKYYALAACQIALDSKDDDVRRQLPDGHIQLAETEYAQGAWYSYCSHLRALIVVHTRYREDPANLNKHAEIAQCIVQASIVLALAERISPAASTKLRAIIQQAGLHEPVAETLSMAKEVWATPPDAALAKQLQEELFASPFSDLGFRRMLTWSALGVLWRVFFDNRHATTSAVEEFVAVLQVLLVDFADEELFLLPTEVTIEVEFARISNPSVIRQREKGANHWTMTLPADETEAPGAFGVPQVFTLAAQILGETTLLPVDEFITLLERAAERGIQSKVFVARRYRQLYESCVDSESFSESERHALSGPSDQFIVLAVSAKELRWRSERIALLKGDSRQSVLENRYRRYSLALCRTLPRLLRETAFVKTVAALRERGWLDWHILAAVFSVAHNYRMQVERKHPPFVSVKEAKEWMTGLWEKPESDGPEAPFEMFIAIEDLDRHRQANMAATLSGMGLRLPPGAQDMSAMERFLADRLGYWTDDVPHVDPFIAGAS